MKIDGIDVYAYVLVTDFGPYVGFDTRPLEEVEAEWLAKWRTVGENIAKAEVEDRKGSILEQQVAKVVIESDPEFGDGKSKVENLKPHPVCTPTKGEVFRLNGIPSRNGFGSVAILANLVKGVSRSVQEESDLSATNLGLVSPVPAPALRTTPTKVAKKPVKKATR